MKSVDHLYENFKKAILDGLGEKYRYLRFNTKNYHNYQFGVAPPYEDGFGFSAPGEEIIRNMLIKFRDETGFMLVGLNNATFILTDQGITELKRRDQSLI